MHQFHLIKHLLSIKLPQAVKVQFLLCLNKGLTAMKIIIIITTIAIIFMIVTVKFPYSPILHYTFSSWIEKTMHCHWEN